MEAWSIDNIDEGDIHRAMESLYSKDYSACSLYCTDSITMLDNAEIGSGCEFSETATIIADMGVTTTV
jgi:hypothetical protein